jgi:acyl-CoA hydrolase
MNEQPAKSTAYSRVTLSRIMTAIDVNLYGTVHGGVIVKFIDDVAGAVAARHSGGNAVTVAIDEIVFEEPVRVGDLVHEGSESESSSRTHRSTGPGAARWRWAAG